MVVSWVTLSCYHHSGPRFVSLEGTVSICLPVINALQLTQARVHYFNPPFQLFVVVWHSQYVQSDVKPKSSNQAKRKTVCILYIICCVFFHWKCFRTTMFKETKEYLDL